jgi:hypothetical protein
VHVADGVDAGTVGNACLAQNTCHHACAIMPFG